MPEHSRDPRPGDQIRILTPSFPHSAPRGSVHTIVRIHPANTPPVPYYRIPTALGSLGLYRNEFELVEFPPS